MAKVISYIQILITGFIIILLPFYTKAEEIMDPVKYMPLFYFITSVSALLIITVIFPEKKRLSVTGIDVFFFIYFLYKNIYIAFIGGTDRYTMWSLIFIMLLYIALRQVRDETIKVIPYIFVLSMFVQSITGEGQLLGILESNNKMYNITGSFFNPALLGGYICCILPVSMMLHKENEEKKWLKTVFLVVIIISVIVLPATHSRAAIISALIVCGYIYIKYFHKENNITKYKKVLIPVFLIMLFGSMYFLKKDSADGRMLIWKISTFMIKEKPVTGYGPNGFEKAYMKEQAEYFKLHPGSKYGQLADNTDYVYNEVLKNTVEYGITGGILFLLIFVLAIKTEKEKKSKYVLASLFIFGLFSYPSNVLFFRAVAVIMLALISNKSQKLVEIKSRIFIPFIIVPFIIVKPMIQFHKDLKDWYYASQYYEVDEKEESCKEYEPIAKRFSRNGEFLIQYGKTLSMLDRDSFAIKVLNSAKRYKTNTLLYTALGDSYKKEKDYEKAEECYMTAKNMVPNRFFPLYLLAKLYAEQGKKEKVVDIYKDMEHKKIKVPSTAIEEMKEAVKKLIK